MSSVRATRGRRSGPITISATRPITINSEKPMSNMGVLRERCPETKRAPSGRPCERTCEPGSGLGLCLSLDLALDRFAGDLRGARVGGLVAVLHPVLEAAHRAAKVRADVAQFLGAEYQHHDHKNDQPVPNAERTHSASYFLL